MDHQRAALLTAYTMARDDERNHAIVIPTLAGLAAALAFGEATQIGRDLPPAAHAIAPAPLLAVLAFMVLEGATAVMRYAYLLGLEAELRRVYPDLTIRGLSRPVFSYQQTRWPITAPVGLRDLPRFPFFLLFPVMLMGIGGVVMGLTVHSLSAIHGTGWFYPALVVYSAATLLIAWSALIGWGNFGWDRHVWQRSGSWTNPGTGMPRAWARRKG